MRLNHRQKVIVRQIKQILHFWDITNTIEDDELQKQVIEEEIHQAYEECGSCNKHAIKDSLYKLLEAIKQI